MLVLALFRWTALALLALSTAWCADPPKPAASAPSPTAAKAPPASPAPKRTATPAVSDAQLEAAIRAKFAKSKISSNKFTVRVQGGVATLEGTTDVIQHKGTATRLAHTAGAVNVNNRIQVSEAARGKAAKNLEEGRRRVQVKRGEVRTQP
jgi:hypothetical protein